MSTSQFIVRTHTFEANHIRQYPAALRQDEHDVLYLEAKQYIPIENQDPQPGDVTILGSPATSFPKELYEPLWDELLARSKSQGFRIRAIWIADASNHGASGVLNEHSQGDDVSFFDYARDLLHMTNVFKKDMIQPIIGVGHSMGATTLVALSHMHPRLLASLTLFDPIIGTDTLPTGLLIIYMASIKPDLYPSMEVAEKVFRKPFKAWDSRCFDLWLKYGLRKTPTLLHPEPGKITLTMSPAQEAWSYSRPFFDDLQPDGTLSPTSRIKYPDAGPDFRPMYRPEAWEVPDYLPKLRPDVLWIAPELSPIDKEAWDRKVNMTGTAIGGSGGVKEGRVEQVVVKGAAHLCTFEKPAECAEIVADWLGRDLKAWRKRVEIERNNRDDKSTADGLRLSEQWIKVAKKFIKDGVPEHITKPKSSKL